MDASSKCLDLICRFEGFSARPYLCPAGVPTIGYGSTRYADGRRVTRLDRAITEPEARRLLAATLQQFEQGVHAAVRVTLSQHQFDALVSFAYNVGLEAFRGSTLVRRLNAGEYAAAAEQLLAWDKAGGKVLAGLTARRKAERALFVGAS